MSENGQAEYDNDLQDIMSDVFQSDDGSPISVKIPFETVDVLLRMIDGRVSTMKMHGMEYEMSLLQKFKESLYAGMKKQKKKQEKKQEQERQKKNANKKTKKKKGK